MAVSAYSLAIQDAEAGGLPQVGVQHELQNETPSQKQTPTNQQQKSFKFEGEKIIQIICVQLNKFSHIYVLM